jgi:regulator of ribosome biosynthesis
LQAQLPSYCTILLPREKPPPKPKEETKWEKFAREKGITNKKKSKMVWDEEKQEWAPRFGYKRAKDDSKSFIELKPGQENDLSDDMFASTRKANRMKNKASQMANEVSHRSLVMITKRHPMTPSSPYDTTETSQTRRRRRGGEGSTTYWHST